MKSRESTSGTMTQANASGFSRAVGQALTFVLVVAGLTSLSTPGHAIIKAGVESFFVVSGTADVESEQSQDGSSAGSETTSFDENTGIGFTAYGLVGAIPFVDVGLAVHYIPTLELKNDDEETFQIGSELDLNLRANVDLPVPVVSVGIFGEGGLTFFSLDDKDDTFKVSDGAKDETSPVGFNAGLGVRARYGFLPLLGVAAGLDFQYYSFEVFSGSTSEPGVGTIEQTTSMSGTRVKLVVGIDFDL